MADHRTNQDKRDRAWTSSALLAVIGTALAALGIWLALPPAPSNPDSGMTTPKTNGADPWFEEVSASVGIDFRHVSGQGERLYMPEIMAGGVCLLDYDRDGNLDIYFVQAGRVVGPREALPGNQLFRNTGTGGFVDVTTATGVGDTGYGMGCTCGDFDNDGWTDLYVTNVGGNVLYRNEEGRRFVDVTTTAGVGDDGFGASAAFFDYDRDGDLDLFVVNYIAWAPGTDLPCTGPAGQPDYCPPISYRSPSPDTLYRNNGDGTFRDVTRASGVSSAYGNGLGVVPADLNDDGWIDLFVANDPNANQLWINLGDGRFRDEALLRGVAFNGHGMAEAGMGVDARDIDGDWDLDLLMTHFARQTNTMYLNDAGFFEDSTSRLGLSPSRAFTGFGMALIDLNNDGAIDTYVANGRVADAWSVGSYGEPNQLYEGVGGGAFREVMPRGGTRDLLVDTSRGAAFGDYDNDGDVDIIVVNRDAAAYVLKNVAQKGGHWIVFRVINTHGADALGARVSFMAGGKTYRRDARAAYSYCSSNDPRVHFGLGLATSVEDVTVRWPDGTTQTFGPFDADQFVTLEHAAGK